MNNGELDELLIQLKLIELRDKGESIPHLDKIKSIGFLKEYNKIPDLLNWKLDKNIDIEKSIKYFGITKSPTNYKADTLINGIPISLKSMRSAPPALVNHTTRPGFEFAADNSDGDIIELDKIIEEYWELRLNKKIAEDISNSDPRSPFQNKKNVLKPFINYFLFFGTGSKLSKLKSEMILSFEDPFDTSTWKLFDKNNAIDLFWDNLVFSLRSKKGMPKGYPDNLSNKMKLNKNSIDKWSRFIDGDWRGSLHIRST